MWDNWSEFVQRLSAGDFIQALSLPASMLVAWLAFRWAAVDARRSMVITDVADQLREFTQESERIGNLIEQHYTGNYEGTFASSRAKESQQEIFARLRVMDQRRETLKIFLRKSAGSQFTNEFDAWQQTALGESFPVVRKIDCCRIYDPPVMAARDAQQRFSRYLAALRQKCLCDGVRFRKLVRV